MLRSIASFLGLQFLCRVIGFLILAFTFVQIVYDGARSIANNALRVTSVNDLLVLLLDDKAGNVQDSVGSIAPWLWTILVAPLTVAPAVAVGLALGTVLLWLGQPGREPIGFLTQP